MRATEFITEAREAPLYHFTLEPKFFRILSTDTLFSPSGKIYFTRDYSRQFIPADILAGSWGFRVNQDLLHRVYGKKLTPGGQPGAWDEKKRQAWLADPKNADTIERVKQGEKSMRVDGASVEDIVAGTITKSQRWESEEHLNVKELAELHKYITGIVYAGGKAVDPIRSGAKFGHRSANAQSSLEEFASLLMNHFTGEKGWKLRDWLFDYMTKFNIPFVYRQQDFSAKAVKSKMFDLWKQRKAEKERRAAEDKKSFIVFRNEQGGGVSVSAPDLMTATDYALKDSPTKFPEGVFGASDISGKETVWFETPKTKVGQQVTVK